MKNTIKVQFKDHTTITKGTWKDMKNLIEHIRLNPNVSGSHLAFTFPFKYITTIQFRILIKLIREHASEVLELGEFLIAGKKGYQITKNKKLIKAWMKKTHAMGISKIKQFHEGEKQLGLVDMETGL